MVDEFRLELQGGLLEECPAARRPQQLGGGTRCPSMALQHLRGCAYEGWAASGGHTGTRHRRIQISHFGPSHVMAWPWIAEAYSTPTTTARTDRDSTAGYCATPRLAHACFLGLPRRLQFLRVNAEEGCVFNSAAISQCCTVMLRNNKTTSTPACDNKSDNIRHVGIYKAQGERLGVA